MATLPSNLGLTNIADGAAIVASDHRTNYSAIQIALNALLTIFGAGTSGQVFGSSGGTTVGWTNTTSVPSGAIEMYAGSSAPTNWLLCDGSAVSRATYATLFGVVGTAYGAGDGSTTFNVPDMRGRMPVGLGTHADVSTLGNSDALAVGSRRPKHKHTVVQPTVGITDLGHAHTATKGFNGSLQGPRFQETGGGSTGSNTTDSATTGITAAASGGTVGPQTGAEPTDSAAYLTVNYIIRT